MLELVNTVIETEYKKSKKKYNQMLMVKNIMSIDIQLDDKTRTRLVDKLQRLTDEIKHFHARLLFYDIISNSNLFAAN